MSLYNYYAPFLPCTSATSSTSSRSSTSSTQFTPSKWSFSDKKILDQLIYVVVTADNK